MQAGRLAWIAAAMAWLGGCGSNLGDASLKLTRRGPEPNGANCAYGGVAIFSGLDALAAVGGTLRVTGNDAIPRAELAALLARLGR